MRAYIIAHDGTDRTASIQDSPAMASVWIDWTKTLLAETLPAITVQVVGDASGPGPLQASLAEALESGNWDGLSRACGDGRTLLVSPFAGCLSRNRLQGFVDRLLSLEAPAALRSRYKVDANANPLWLRPLPHDGRFGSATQVSWDACKKTDPGKYCQVVADRYANKEILGSQYLPDMYTEDDALVGLAPAAPGRAMAEEHHYYDKDADTSLPILYRLGILNLHPGQRLALSPKLTGHVRELLDHAARPAA